MGNFAFSFVVYWIFSKSTFSKNYFRNTIIVSNSLDPDQAWQNVEPDLDPNLLFAKIDIQQTTLVDKELIGSWKFV